MSDEDLHDFSAKGKEAFAQTMDRIRTKLRDTARNVCAQGGADTTSADHVAEAYRLLNARSPSRTRQLLGNLGNLFIGVGLSLLVSMIANDQHSPTGVWIGVGFCLVGGALAPLTWLRWA